MAQALFAIESDWSYALAKGESQAVAVSFSPTAADDSISTVEFTGSDGSLTATVTGTGTRSQSMQCAGAAGRASTGGSADGAVGDMAALLAVVGILLMIENCLGGAASRAPFVVYIPWPTCGVFVEDPVVDRHHGGRRRFSRQATPRRT
ncbi:MAG: hypothetical protein QGG73_02185 [Candidatus Hydrogenedentes bacterium]|nr:hypothetical protein [Candidatus Hydrogenedentota bacterium]